jgi:hypothetical protein
MDSNQENSPVAGPVDQEATVMLNTAKNTCMWNGQSYLEGANVNDGIRIFECNYGQWVKI